MPISRIAFRTGLRYRKLALAASLTRLFDGVGKTYQ